MRIVAADSGGSILDDRFEPTCVVCTVAVLVEPPYRAPTALLAEAHFRPIEDSYALLVRELELAEEMVREHGADVVHLDMSLRGARLDELGMSELAHIPERVRVRLAKVLPKLTFLASRIAAEAGAPVLAIGKDSVPVRIAELCCAAHALLYSAEKAIREKREFLLGLPTRCVVESSGGLVVARSLIPSEHDIVGLARDEGRVLKWVNLLDMPNPVARGFRVIRIRPEGS